MAALYLDANLETYCPFSCFHTHCMYGDLFCGLQEGCLQALQVSMMLSATMSFNTCNPQFTVQGVLGLVILTGISAF